MNTVAFAVLLAIHILVDFYLQSNETARQKERSRKALRKHCVQYAIGVGALVSLLCIAGLPIHLAMLTWGVLSSSHLIIDAVLKPCLETRMEARLLVAAIDQALHAAACGAVSVAFLNCRADISAWSSFADLGVWVTSLLFCWRPASIFIRLLLEDMRGEKTDVAYEVNDNAEALRFPGSGALIGILERTLVCSLTLLGQFDAIAFVVAAKSIARFERFKDDAEFAEIYLVGTLSSVAIAMLTALFFNWLFVG